MYPGPDAPDLGTFVAQVERGLVERGHEVDRAVLDTRAGGKRRYLELARRTLRASRPDVVYAHFLVPSGLIAALGSRAPLVVTAHGQDVRNIGELPGIAAATRIVVRRAATVVCVSDYLRRELETRLPAARGKIEVVSTESISSDSRSRPHRPGRRASSASARWRTARTSCGWPTRSRGSARGLSRSSATGRCVRSSKRVPQSRSSAAFRTTRSHGCSQRATCSVSRSSSSRSARRCSRGWPPGRPVVATRIGGPPEFVPPEAGVLVDPLDVEADSPRACARRRRCRPE